VASLTPQMLYPLGARRGGGGIGGGLMAGGGMGGGLKGGGSF